MVTTNIKQSALSAQWPGGRSIPPRFAGGANTVWKAETEAVVRGLKQANWTRDKLFSAKIFNMDVRKGGLSLEDVAGRLQTLIGVYLLQGYYSIKDDKHPWETNGRNALIWVMTLMLQNMTKSESHGVNTLLFNPFMRQKGSLSFEREQFQKVIDRFRMDADYLDILQDSGISVSHDDMKGAKAGKKALWAASWLDDNKANLIKKRYEVLKEKALRGTLSQEEQKIYQSIPRFFRRINGLNIASTGLIMGATIYLIGGVAMKIVNKVISPLDKDYHGNKHKQPGELQKHSPFAKSHPPSPSLNAASHTPTQFKYFPNYSAYPNSSYPGQSNRINFNSQNPNNQNTANPNTLFHPSVSNPDSSSIQFFQSYVSHRRQSPPTLPGGLN